MMQSMLRLRRSGDSRNADLALSRSVALLLKNEPQISRKPEVCAPKHSAVLAVAFLLLIPFVAARPSFAQDASENGQQSPAEVLGHGQPVQLEGELEIIHQDVEDGRGRDLYSLKQLDGTRVPLQFVKEPPTHLLTGDHVRVSGQPSGSGLLLYSGSTNVRKTKGSGTTSTSSCSADSGSTCSTITSIPVPNTFGAQKTLVILVNFQDDAIQPFTVASVQNTFFGTGNTLNSFISENSYGQTSITGAVVGWYTIPDSVTTCSNTQIATDANNAATAAGANLSNYTRLVYVYPNDTSCGFAGASTVGGNPSESWINGTLDIHVINHEL